MSVFKSILWKNLTQCTIYIIPRKVQDNSETESIKRSLILIIIFLRYEGEHTFTDISRLIQSKVRINHAKDFPRQPLIQLDDQNFDRIVKDTTKDVLVFYYTEWCAKCKNLTHVVGRVADTFKVYFFSIPGYAYQGIGIAVCTCQSYPTLKNVQSYINKSTGLSIVQVLHENTSSDIKLKNLLL